MNRYEKGEASAVTGKVEEFIRRYDMIRPGDVVLVGFSGGADSVLLTELLWEAAQKKGFSVRAVHVHHHLRMEEAERDAAFAEDFCAVREIPFCLYSCPVAEVARERHLSLEEAGRLERKRVFEQCRNAYGGTKLALAHHQNDLAETMIHHLARGTSLSGLAALRPVRGHVIRPLLCLGRKEIEEELRRRNLSWCEDSTNDMDDYTRNGIRHHVIPYLEQRVNPKTVEHMAKTSMDLMEAEEFFVSEARRLSDQYCAAENQKTELSEQLRWEPEILQRYLVRECLEHLAGCRKDLDREHLESVLGLWQKRVGKSVCLPYGMRAVRRYDGISLLRQEDIVPVPGACTDASGTDCAAIQQKGVTSWGNFQVRVSFPEKYSGNFERISENKYTKCFNYDRIKAGLVLRTRKSGDFLTVREDGGRKKLKDFMIDVKIPREQRDSILLVADGQEIVWVVGWRVSERYRVREDTEKIIQLEISGGYTNEGKNTCSAQRRRSEPADSGDRRAD